MIGINNLTVVDYKIGEIKNMGYSIYTVNKLRNIKRHIKSNDVEELKKINLKKIFRNKKYNHSIFGEMDMYEYLFYYALTRNLTESSKYIYFKYNLGIYLEKNKYYDILTKENIDYIKILQRFRKIEKIKKGIN